jgi:predicted phosphodiesterase
MHLHADFAGPTRLGVLSERHFAHEPTKGEIGCDAGVTLGTDKAVPIAAGTLKGTHKKLGRGTMSGKFRLAQISDTHVRAADGGSAASQLKRAMAQARAYGADVILLTGDLVNDEREDEYAVLAEAIADPPAPLFLMPGNHDERAQLRRWFSHHGYLPRHGPLHFTIEDYPSALSRWTICAGRSAWFVGSLGAGGWDPRSSERTTDLGGAASPPSTRFAVRHNRAAGCGEFATVIARHRQVVRVICGHHHRVGVGQTAHAPVVSGALNVLDLRPGFG